MGLLFIHDSVDLEGLDNYSRPSLFMGSAGRPVVYQIGHPSRHPPTSSF